MITFYKNPACPQCEETQEALENLAIAHKVVPVPTEAGRVEQMPQGKRAPLLVDGDEMFEGHEAINRHFDELEEFVALWRKFQTDACYCDDEGNPE